MKRIFAGLMLLTSISAFADITCKVETEDSKGKVKLIYSESKSESSSRSDGFESSFSIKSKIYQFYAEANKDSVAFILTDKKDEKLTYVVTSGLGYVKNVNEDWNGKVGASVTYFENRSRLENAITMTCIKD